MINDEKQDGTMIERLLEYKAFVGRIVVEAFTPTTPSSVPQAAPGSPNPFNVAVRVAFTAALATRGRRPSELLAKYLDAEMRKGQQGSSDLEFRKKVDAAIGLYGFLSEHDVFRTYSLRLLGKRLLLQRSASDDFEKAFLKKLEADVDSEFEKGLKMFEDIELSRTQLADYHATHPSQSFFSAYVLQESAWQKPPASAMPAANFTLPPVLQDPLDEFVRFYAQRQPKRKLTWAPGFGSVTLLTRFDKGEKALSLSLWQALVMLLFEDVDKLTFADIRAAVEIVDLDELKRTVQSLALGRRRVLTKRPQTVEVLDSDEFIFNRAFEDKSRNVRINTIQAQESPEERQAIEKEVDAFREGTVDAGIVRIMKGAKNLSHQELLIRTIEVVKRHFDLQPQYFKARVESLLDREYIAREGSGYTYVA
ncbi:hypothetical protein DL93DRAFT_2063738 [Clavulina sp. PMI_390]|nr:hypothetical protein DL93DRAFT_2063738 [Clavulina sp. PMI_390]